MCLGTGSFQATSKPVDKGDQVRKSWEQSSALSFLYGFRIAETVRGHPGRMMSAATTATGEGSFERDSSRVDVFKGGL